MIGIASLNIWLIVAFCIGRCVINKMPFTLGYKISYITVISTEALKLFRRISFFLSRFLDILMVFLNLATLGSKRPSKCLETSREKKKSRLNNFISRLSTNNSDINSYFVRMFRFFLVTQSIILIYIDYKLSLV